MVCLPHPTIILLAQWWSWVGLSKLTIRWFSYDPTTTRLKIGGPFTISQSYLRQRTNHNGRNHSLTAYKLSKFCKKKWLMKKSGKKWCRLSLFHDLIDFLITNSIQTLLHQVLMAGFRIVSCITRSNCSIDAIKSAG